MGQGNVSASEGLYLGEGSVSGDLHLEGSASWGSGRDTWDTTGHDDQQAGGTHPTGMLSSSMADLLPSSYNLFIPDLVNMNVPFTSSNSFCQKKVLKTDIFSYSRRFLAWGWRCGKNGGFRNERIYSSGTDRVYSGRGSPEKAYNPRSSAEMRARASAFSASTIDSFDYAFQRDPRNRQAQNDDFFDT